MFLKIGRILAPMTAAFIERLRVGGYREFFAPAPLRHAVGFLWTHETPVGETAPYHRVLPDPGAAIVFYCERGVDGAPHEPALYLHGPIDTPRFHRLTPRRELIGVTFKAEWLPSLLSVSPREALDAIAPLHAIAPDWAERTIEALAGTRSAEQALMVLTEHATALAAQARVRYAPAARAVYAFDVIRRARGRVRIAELSARVGLSERHLRRVSRDALGLTPKDFARRLRFLSVMESADSAPAPDWAGLAARGGYFDQSHFISEAKALSGVAPRRLHAERRAQAPSD